MSFERIVFIVFIVRNRLHFLVQILASFGLCHELWLTFRFRTSLWSKSEREFIQKYENTVNRNWPQFKIVSRQMLSTSSGFARQVTTSLKPIIHKIQIAQPSLSIYFSSSRNWFVTVPSCSLLSTARRPSVNVYFEWIVFWLLFLVDLPCCHDCLADLELKTFLQIKLRVCMSCWSFVALPNKFCFMMKIGRDIKCNKDSNQSWGDIYHGSV
jgi:hypothetical protein